MSKIIAKPISRRSFVKASVCAATAEVAALSSDKSNATPASAELGRAVEQNTIRRRGTGMRALNVAKASPGFTLYATIGGRNIYLTDLNGTIIHIWQLPYPVYYGYLTERGTLLCNGKIPNDTLLGRAPPHCGVLLEADWNGKVLWEVRNPDHHHDGRLLKNGNVILVCARALPDEVASKVQGGLRRQAESRPMAGDYLLEMTTTGQIVWEWRSWEHLNPAEDSITAMQDERTEWTHANGVHELPDANLLVSFRNISTVITVDRRSGAITWKLGAPPLSGQHAPTPLSSGNILLFDNGPHRLDQALTFSRVLEIDPATNNIVWTYQDAIPMSFYSARISNAQRLPNGNTLINEGLSGRFFEVTSGGEVVWEYVNPYFTPNNAPSEYQQNQTFRAYRYTEGEIQKARRA